MAIRYYDEAISEKIKKWLPDNSKLRVLKPDESKRFFETVADDNNDSPFKLPLLAISRSNDIEILSTAKQTRSYDGLKLLNNSIETLQLNIIPIKVTYQLDIYTKRYEDGDEYVRSFLFKLINNPAIIIEIPYNNTQIQHRANIRVLSTVSDTSDISEHLFPGQFTRWTIQMDLQDAYLFSIPYRGNWHIGEVSVELSDKIDESGIIEYIENPAPIYFWNPDWQKCTAKVVANRETGETVEEVVIRTTDASGKELADSKIKYTIVQAYDKLKGLAEIGYYTAYFTNPLFKDQQTQNIMIKWN